MAHAIVGVEEFDDFGEIFAEEGFAAGDPKLVKGRRGLADAFKLVKAEIATLSSARPSKSRCGRASCKWR